MGRGARWKKLLGLVAPVLWLAGCGGYESAYERAVYDDEPVYCYRTLADIDCFRAPDVRAERRLVNYYGPSPRRAARAEVEEIRLAPPPAIEPNPETKTMPTNLTAPRASGAGVSGDGI